MNREQVASGLLALLAVLALGGVAATLNPPTGGSGGGSGSGEGAGIGSDSSFRPGGGFEPVDPPELNLPEWLGPLVALVVLLLTAYGCYELYREYGPRQLLGGAAAVAAAALALYALLSLLDGAGSPDRGSALPSERLSPSGGGASAGETVTRAVDPPTALLVVLGLALIGAVVVIVRASGDEEVELETPASTEDPPETDVSAVADAAGRAADRIEADADLENAVFRAWREMTADLPVDSPDTSTPAEFADAAVAAGMDRTDVAELTRLFEEVRYGDRPATDERAANATAALRRIERSYGDEPVDGPAGAAGGGSIDEWVDDPGTEDDG
ncbi:DUF4129 domain-containing protein [Haloglomus litoreum]|uniref:DUF4129 domain-containing protein n=1 Tax=Haloglomus litoreum TaxID=3034026 RepID=UPI0023E8BBC4|nr:DUF4129 domain-containing protein [Haloglomus sp. DT116]